MLGTFLNQKNLLGLIKIIKYFKDYYQPEGVGNFHSNNYIEYECNVDTNKTLSIRVYLNEIRPYLKDINILKKSETWKIQLTLAIKFVF